MSHNSSNFCIFQIFSCAELSETKIKVGFFRSFSGASLECDECSTTNDCQGFKKFRNVFELEKHLSTSHKKVLKSIKCPRCPASFFNEHVYRYALFKKKHYF